MGDSKQALPCPCGRLTTGARSQVLSFDVCCAPYVRDGQIAPDPESLMRSRYTAFTRANEAYLRATWLPERTPKTIHLDASDKWLGLTVKSTAMLSSEEGTVHFVARVRTAGRAHRIEENSRFALRDGQWLYVGAASAA